MNKVTLVEVKSRRSEDSEEKMASKDKSTSVSKSNKLDEYLGELTPLQGVALSKYSVAPEEFMGDIVDMVEEGAHNVDFIVRISGILVKNADHLKTPSNSVPWLVALALLVRRSGATRKKSIKLLIDVLKESLEYSKSSDDSKKTLLAETGVQEAMDQLKEHFGTLPKSLARGHINKRYKVNMLTDIESTKL